MKNFIPLLKCSKVFCHQAGGRQMERTIRLSTTRPLPICSQCIRSLYVYLLHGGTFEMQHITYILVGAKRRRYGGKENIVFRTH